MLQIAFFTNFINLIFIFSHFISHFFTNHVPKVILYSKTFYNQQLVNFKYKNMVFANIYVLCDQIIYIYIFFFSFPDK